MPLARPPAVGMSKVRDLMPMICMLQSRVLVLVGVERDDGEEVWQGRGF